MTGVGAGGVSAGGFGVGGVAAGGMSGASRMTGGGDLGLAARLEPLPGLAEVSAAVLVPLAFIDGHPQLTLIQKAGGRHFHAGQVAFPGGHCEAGDTDVASTAMREAQEEIGIFQAELTVIGALPIVAVAATGSRVAPVVGQWSPRPLTPESRLEVADVRQLWVADLAEEQNRVTAVHPSGYRGPAFVVGDWFIWGLTGRIIDVLLKRGGWQRPWDRERTAKIPHQFR